MRSLSSSIAKDKVVPKAATHLSKVYVGINISTSITFCRFNNTGDYFAEDKERRTSPRIGNII